MKEFNVQINPYLEFINSILLTSKYNEITKPFIGYGLMTEEINEYTSSIKAFFEDYKDNGIYNLIENMIPNGFTFSRPVELALSLGSSDDFSVQYKMSQLCIKYCGGRKKIDALLIQAKSLAETSNYFSFFQDAKSFYEPIVNKVKEDMNKIPFISLLEDEYGKTQNSYNFVISSLMRGNYGINFSNEISQEADLFSVFTTDNFSLSPIVIFHEYSHPFINPLTEKYKNEVMKYSEAHQWLSQYRLPDYQSGYGDWEECVNEHLVRGMVIHLLNKCDYVDLAQEALQNELNRGYRYIPLILEKYEYYDKNRNIFHSFDKYFLELIDVFSQKI